MSRKLILLLSLFILIPEYYVVAGKNSINTSFEISNNAYRLTVRKSENGIHVRFYDKLMDFIFCDGPYLYRIAQDVESGTMHYKALDDITINSDNNSIMINAEIGNLNLNHEFILPNNRPIMEEQISLRNESDAIISLNEFEMGFQTIVTNEIGEVKREFEGDRFVAVPFRHRASDPPGFIHDYSIADVVNKSGFEPRLNEFIRYKRIPSRHRYSEGWAWMHGEYVLGIYKFNQEHMEFSTVSTQAVPEGVVLRFGGSCMRNEEPSVLKRISPGKTVNLGVMRYQTLKGDYTEALYALRNMLDEKGCRFPDDFNPPIHWNELYDNPEWQGVSTPGQPYTPRASVRKRSYSRELIEQEAAKARDYSCESLYLDPGWDTVFGSFKWGKEWLGSQSKFVKMMKSEYGLAVSLHCPLATWMSHPRYRMDNTSYMEWPKESERMDPEGNVIEQSVCLGSQQYLREAEKRLLKCCEAGVKFIMLDGNWWNGGCWNQRHGHPVPYRKEDHVRANLHLAQQIHTRYPDVLIEMHDMIAGGSRYRMTPVYYKYGLPGSYDDNWGFELMWAPFEDLKEGRGLALYYYNMGCNVPVYLHIDLRNDNEHCFVLWWFASTCRHLGIGGTHPNPLIAANQRAAMKKYRSLDRFYKRGDFFGINEEIHIHVLKEENAFVLNVFNLSDESRIIKGSIPVEKLGIDPDRWYIRNGRIGRFDKENGVFVVNCKLQPWASELSEFQAW